MSWLDKYFNVGIVTIQIAGVPYPQERILNFSSGATATDDPANGRTNIAGIANSGYNTIEQAGAAATQRAIANFINGSLVSVAVADNAGATRTDITVGISPGTAGQLIVTNAGATAPAWVSASQDLTLSSAGAFAVVQLTGNAGSLPLANALTAISGTAPGSDVAPNAITITGQGPFASATVNKSSATITLATAAALAGGSIGAVLLSPGGTTALQLAAATTDFVSIGGPTSGTGRTSATGLVRFPYVNGTIIAARNFANNADHLVCGFIDNSNSLRFGGTSLGAVYLTSGASANVQSNGGASLALNNSGTSVIWQAAPTMTFSTSVAINPVSAGTALTMTISGGASTTNNNNGGAIAIKGGATAGGSGLRGVAQLFLGQSDCMVEATEVVLGNRVTALARGVALTSTEMPANSGDKVCYVGNAGTAPTASPVSGCILYATGGNLAYYTSGGQQVTLPTTTSATATGGTSITLPAFIQGYLSMSIAGTTIKVPYYQN